MEMWNILRSVVQERKIISEVHGAMPDLKMENLNRGITFSLKKSGYEVFSAESVKKAKRTVDL